jgi:hypothetical protein
MKKGWLQKPYYWDSTPSAALKLSALFGFFVFLFLTVFQPFGIRGMPGSFLGVTAGFGALTFGVMLILNIVVPLIVPTYFEEERWTVGKEILYALVNLWAIGTANFLYFAYTTGSAFSPGVFWLFQFITVAVGAFPIVFLTLTRERQSRAAYEKNAEDLTEELPRGAPDMESTMVLQFQNGPDSLKLLTSELRYLQAADNYVYVHFFRGSAQRRIIRATLKSLEADLFAHPNFLRCHKSYIVNLENVLRVSGNAQGYKLHLSGLEEPIPVSRQHNTTIKARLSICP